MDSSKPTSSPVPGSPAPTPSGPAPASAATDTRPSGLWQRRWFRWPVIGIAVWLLICGLLALALPFGLNRWGLPKAAELIGRPISAEKIRFNPFTLRLMAQNLRVAGPASAAPAGGTDLLTLAEFDINLSIKSLRYLAPVIEGLRIVEPRVSIARLPDGRFDFHDIVERIEALPPSPEPPPEQQDKGPAKFAFHNIELVNGEVHFDDRQLEQKHDVTALQLGLPFLSTLPADIETEVKPALSALLDGSPLAVGGDTLPFHDSRRTELAVKLDDLVIGKYLALSPVALGFSSPAGKLSLDLKLGFVHEAGGNRLVIDGPLRVDALVLDARDGTRLVGLQRLVATLGGFEPLASRFPLSSVTVDGLDVRIVREANGLLPIVKAFTPGAGKAAGGEASKASASEDAAGRASTGGETPTTWSVAATTVRDSRILFTDRTTTPPAVLDQHAISIELGAIGNAQTAAAPVTLALKHNEGGQFGWHGELDLAKATAQGKLELALAGLADYLPYLSGPLAATPASGPISFATTFEAGWADDFALRLNDGKAAIEAVQLALPNDKAKDAAVRLGRVAVEGLTLSLAERQVGVARATLANADLRVVRDARGRLNLSTIAASEPATPGGAPVADKTRADKASNDKASNDKAAPAWAVAVSRVDLENNRVEWQDLATPSPVKLPVSKLSGSITDVGTRLDQTSRADLRMTVGRNGQLTLKGSAVAEPLALDMNLSWRNLALAVIDPYLAESVGIELKRGDAAGNGRLRYGSDRARFAGRLALTGLAAAERRTGDDLLRWKTLSLSQVDADVSTAGGRAASRARADKVSIGEVALSDFFARVELSSDGRLNLSDLMQSADGTPQEKAPPTASSAAKADGPPMQIHLGGIRLENGAGNFTDHFVRPNYSADLTQLTGTISAMSSEGAEPADVDVTGSINGDAPISIGGKVNPLGPSLFTDITASAKGIDLPTFSPYSGKYAGYAIEKGKLSVDVHYKIQDAKLEASNRIFLDQLTFGDKVDSPDATSLPVEFAIGLLKNSKGEIDLNLPIGGSLDDPEFSFGGIIWNAFVNLITKVVTSPFTALASAFGGEGEELSFVSFRPGTAVLDDDAGKRLEMISKALKDRPALKLEISGRMDPRAEASAFGKARLEVRLRQLQRGQTDDSKDESADAVKATRGDGAGKAGAAVAAAAAPIPAAQREALVKRLAQQLKVPLTLPPPAQDAKAGTSKAADAVEPSPAPSLETRVAEALAADPEAQRQLAVRRSQAPRNWLVNEGGISADRIFLLAPKVATAAAGGADAAASTSEQPAADAAAGERRAAAAGDPHCTRDCAEFSLR